ncbi:MAG TPA: 23S rRNA (adenine(2503)-C(2))-methyltransferase RlmN [Candidatus Limnocylindrales bacterium]|nr:23S rRNA (adenine(2503)-C(2))-methyltransferase RlmN [Candidatus Limnocylindrales bacterium]
MASRGDLGRAEALVMRPRASADPRRAITDVDEHALGVWLRDRAQPPYRAKQIRRQIARGLAADWESLTDLPKPLRNELETSFRWSAVEPVHEIESADNETRKVLLKLHDGHHIESVLMPHHGARNTVCFSTQAGCPMACAFCATGEMGLIRNLSVGEIVDQIRHWQRELLARGERVSHVVAMGMGEPLSNLDATVAAVGMLIDPELFGISPRRVTISTVGVVPGMDALAALNLPMNLAVSLHAPNDEIRSAIVPLNKRWKIDEVLAASRRYVERTKRRITFEYVLLANVNDAEAHAAELAQRIGDLGRVGDYHVNLIPVNPGPGGFARPPVDRMERFAQILQDHGIAATLRISKGQDIAAGCGQLKVPEGRARPREVSALG